MTDREWDRRLHIKTIGREDEASADYSPYEPTPYAVLQRLADSGWLRRKDRLLDYGCGKGRAVFFLASVVGCRVTGVDYAQKLIDLARENRRTSKLGDRVKLVCGLAEQHEIGDENAFFFFNPFSEKVFAAVLRRLAQSWRAHPRTMTLFCYYPSEAYLQCLEDADGLSHAGDIDCSDLFNGKNPRERIAIYRFDAPGDGG